MKFTEALKLVLAGKTLCRSNDSYDRIRMNDQVFERWGTHFAVPRWYPAVVGSTSDSWADWIEYVESFDFFEAIKRIEKGEKVQYESPISHTIFYKKDQKLVYSIDGITNVAGTIGPSARFISVP